MISKQTVYMRNLFALALASSALSLLTGCATGFIATAPASAPVSIAIEGNVHGGQQAVTGSTITAYATGTTGYGSASRVLGTTTTDSNGHFSLTAYANCTTGDNMYIVSAGGNPGVTGTHNNSALAMMTALGACSNINANTKVTINELSTVASVWALAPFMKDATHIGTSASNATGMTNAMNTVSLKLVDVTKGVIPSPSLNSEVTSFPTALINTLADILAACINTVDSTTPAAQSSICQTVLAGAAVNGVAPANTISAALNLAQNPTVGLALYTQGTPTAPYQPTLGTTTAPTSWTLALGYGFTPTDATPNVPKGIAINPTTTAGNPAGTVYSVGAGTGPTSNSLIAIYPDTGAVIETHYTGTTIENQPSALAIDTASNIWTTDSANNSLIETGPNAPTGGGGIHTGNGLSAPSAVAIDAAGNIWVTNFGNSSVSEFSKTGAAIGNFTSGIASPVAIAVSPK